MNAERPQGTALVHGLSGRSGYPTCLSVSVGRVANSGVGRRMGRGAPVSRFINRRETEAEREQPILLAEGPRAGKPKTLAQPQHRLEALDGPPRCVKGLETA